MLLQTEKMQIYDPIYDEVIMPSKSAESVICTRHLQRLASLSQLCGLSKLHPSAHHCRYTHSIGVSHLAKKFVIHLLGNCKQMQHLDVRKYSTIAEIAGLCHDIGHGPFSHLFETVMREISPGRPFHHESCSVALIDHMIRENRLEEVFYADCGINRRDIDLIKSMILGQKEEYFQKYPEASRRDEAFLFDIIANNRNGIDVDRMDYLQRDSYFLKAPHRIDYRQLIESSKLVIGSDESQIAFDIKNIDEIVNLFTLREFMYMNYYCGARNDLMKKIILNIITLGNAEPYIFHPDIKDLRDICDDPLLIIHLTDDKLLQAIEDSKSNRDEIVEAKSALDRLTKKDFGQIVAEISVDEEFNYEEFKNEFTARFKDSPSGLETIEKDFTKSFKTNSDFLNITFFYGNEDSSPFCISPLQLTPKDGRNGKCNRHLFQISSAKRLIRISSFREMSQSEETILLQFLSKFDLESRICNWSIFGKDMESVSPTFD